MTETTTATKPNGANGAKATNGSAPKAARQPSEKVPVAKILNQLSRGMHPQKVADGLGVHISTVYYYRKRGIASGELKPPPGEPRAAAKKTAKKKPKHERGAALSDAMVYLQHAQDAAAPELRGVSNHALLAELALRRLDGRMK